MQPLGIWRCRVNYWLREIVTEVSYEEGFEFYKDGFRRAIIEAENFVRNKYKLNSILSPLDDAALLEKYKAIQAKQQVSVSRT